MSPECTRRVYTLILPISRCGDILLGTKARGFGEGKICGFGGKVESFDASIEAAASRELAEELNLINTPPLSRRGLLLFTFQPDRFAMEVHVFSCELDRGLRSNPSDEFLKPLQWYSRHENSLPYESMWPDAKIWMPVFLGGRYFRGQFSYFGSEYREVVPGFDLTIADLFNPELVCVPQQWPDWGDKPSAPEDQ